MGKAYDSKVEEKWGGILVLKAGDAHWQEFARLRFENNKNLKIDQRMTILNGKLNYLIPTFTERNGVYITSQYELQKD